MATYLFDANALISAARTYYAYDIAPGFWEALDDACGGSLIRIPTIVLEEVTSPSDLVEWLSDRNALHSLELLPDADTVSKMEDVATFVTDNYQEHQAEKFLSGGDPWLVAHALAIEDAHIVTLENAGVPDRHRKTGPYLGPPKIPFVAKELGASSLRLFDAMRGLGIRLDRVI